MGGKLLVSGASIDMAGSLANAGTVLVSSGTLTVDGTLRNTKLIETLSAGTAIINGTINNSGGTLFASGAGSLIEIVGVVSGGVAIIGNGIVDIETAGSTEKVTFLSNGSGGLEIIDTQANTSAYAGKVSGFGGVHGSNTVQFIDLVSVTFTGVVSESYSPTTTSSGVLTVTSGGTAVAKINLLGTGYTTSGFHLSSGPGGSGTIITDPPVVSGGTTQTTSASALIPPNSLLTCHRLLPAPQPRSPIRRTAIPAAPSRCPAKPLVSSRFSAIILLRALPRRPKALLAHW